MRVSTALLVLLCAASVAIVLVARIAIGPADLYEKDQPKTLAYTADVLLHGRWALPRDVIYQPATKPPLYNWIAAGVMTVTRSWSELAMKSPSVLGAIGVAIVLGLVSWHERFVRDLQQRGAHATIIAALACAIWFSFGVEPRHASVIRLMFLARPDMLQAFFLTAAWAAATICFARARSAQVIEPPGERSSSTPFRLLASERHSDRSAAAIEASETVNDVLRHSWLAIIFWFCLTGAILTKGPLALLLIVYVILAARVIGGSWQSIARLRPIIGLLVTATLVGSWFFLAYRADADHVRGVMLGAEIIGRVTTETPEGIAKPFWYSAMWFLTKGGPFAILAMLSILVMAWRHRRGRANDPISIAAALWLVVLLAGLTLPAGKRMDYLLPTFAPAAYLAARLLVELCRRLRIPVALAGLLPLAMSLMLAHATLTKFHESREHWSDDAVAFTREVRSRVGDDETLLVSVRGKHPLTTLLRRHQGTALDRGELERARWIILPLTGTTAEPILRSEMLPLGFETVETRPRGVIGLFDMQSEERPTIEELVAAQKQVATWTVEENPYRSPGTVWSE